MKSILIDRLKNGIYYSFHAREKMEQECITEKEIIEAIKLGDHKIDYSRQTDRTRAWNKKPHITIIYKNLTIVACESAEKGVLIISCYHGKPHDFWSNPYNKKRLLKY